MQTQDEDKEDCPECNGTGCELTFEDGRFYVEGDCLECGGSGDKKEEE